MRVKYNTLPSYNPLFPHKNPRFAVHPAAFSEPAAGHNNVGLHNLNFPSYPHPACRPFDSSLACHLPAGKGYLSPTQLHDEPRNLSNPSTPGRAAA